MRRLATWCVRHRRTVLAIWLVALIGFSAVSQAAKSDFSTKFQLSNTQSSHALTLLQREFPAVSGSSDEIAVHALSGTVTDPAVRSRVEAMLARVATLPHVRSVVSPYSPAGAKQVSANRTIAYATVVYNEQAQSVTKALSQRLIRTAQSADSAQLHVAINGQDIENAESQSGSASTGIGVILALIVLGVAFGALFAAFLPIITALVAIGIGYAITGLLSHVFSVASFATILGVLIGLGVGVDYALFIVTRHRTGLKGGRSVEDAAVNAVNTAGRAVFFAGITVCIALLGQFALGVSFLYGVAVSAAITVALTMLSSLTLLPALLGFFGTKVLSRRERAALASSGPVAEQVTGAWRRWAQLIERRPVLPATVALFVVLLIGVPFLSLRLGIDDAGSDAASTTTRQAYDLLSEGFGPGFSGPLQIVAALPARADVTRFSAIVDTLARQPGVVRASTPVLSPSGTVAVADLYPATSPQSKQTSTLVTHLRSTVIPRLSRGTGVRILVGGATAIQIDFASVLSSKLPLFIAVVVVLAFLLLVAVFRSLLIPLIASVMNLLSVAAALGIMDAVFEKGWGASLFGITGRSPVEVFIPVLLFSILFGLSMDYEVFLVSRMHEQWLRTHDNQEAVTLGQAETGRVITAAALIMILVFASFVLGDSIIIKQFGIGLAGAIIVDAFIIRTVLVPSIMHLTGKANWWLPAWLDRIIPHLSVEADDSPPVTEAERIPVKAP